ncbi:MAG: efflux RND transporter periplasmic adaptor subunit [Planctomycetaceae bacterium]
MSQRFKTGLRRSVALIRPTTTVLLVLLLGTGLGMAAKAWFLPLLPPSIARALGLPEPTRQDGKSTAQSGREVAFWKSSMIPNFVSPKPGIDPMNMALIPVYVDELRDEKFITLSQDTMQNMGIRTVPVESGHASRVLRTIGNVDYAEPLLGDVTLKIDGWVEDLFVDYVGKRVKKGEPLFTVYSRELYVAEVEYLIDLKNPQSSRPNSPLSPVSGSVLSAYDKLRYWDVPESEIQKLKKRGHPMKAVTFVSPFDGWVIEKHAFRGMYMKAGEPFYRIADLSKMWVYVTIFEYQLPRIRVGQTVRLSSPYRPGEVFTGKIIYIYPYVDPKTRQIRVRLEFPNPNLRLKPEMYADVQIELPIPGKQIFVPQDAVVDVGATKQVRGKQVRVGFAYVMVGPGKFEPREVQLGEELAGGRLQILAGLKPGENVVVSGQFQLDSERKVKEANLEMFMRGRGEK